MIACNLLVFDSNEGLSFEIIVAVIDMFSLVGQAFAYFYLSERITENLLNIHNIFYNSEWYRLTPKRRGLLKLPIQRAQRLLRLTSLGLVDCSLPVFSSVRLG